jgi:energy-converting hydrogenase Eha subunit A
MRCEYEHIATDTQAFTWAAGCFLASLKERMIMIKGDLKISRWLLTPELLLCFLPLTLLWLDAIDGRSGLLRLDRASIQKHFIAVPGGTVVLIALICGVILASIGPIALAAALRLIVWKRPVRSAWLRAALVAAPVLYGVIALLARTAEMGAAAFSVAASDAFDFWSGIVLLSVLPALGAAHLLRFSAKALLQPA